MNKWYRSRGVKGFWFVIGHAALAFLIVCVVLINTMSGEFYISSMKDFKELNTQSYDESQSFANKVYQDSSHALSQTIQKTNLETDGKYDEKKIVDIHNYINKDKINGKNETGFAYTLGDLYNWAHELDLKALSAYNDGGIVVVGKKPDSTYHYYTYSEFESLINNNHLKLSGNDVYQGDILRSLKDGFDTSYYQNQDITIQDESGKELYTQFWSLDEVIDERYAPDGAENILEIANTNPEWNGKLVDMYTGLETALDCIRNDVEDYQTGATAYEEGNTNFAYLLVDQTGKKVYTNRKAYNDYSKVDASIKEMESKGRYVKVTPKLSGFETNMETTATDWINSSSSNSGWNKRFEQVAGDNFIFVANVDTTYPIQDEYYQADANYQSYAPTFKLFTFFACLSFLIGLIGIIWLTITAGRVATDDELHLYKFDEIWTGVGLMVSLCLWVPGYLSIVRRIKAGNLWEKSILRKLCIALREFWGSRKLTWKAALAVFGLFLLHWITFSSGDNGLMILLMLAAEVAAFLWVIRLIVAKEKILKGIEEIAGGNVSYQIPLKGLKGDNLRMAEAVNGIGDGLQNAVEKGMKDERLKTDLITNVSHDIKTPLTSIINYVDLLKREQIDDPKIQGYIEILEQKAQRLKQLTEDVVEASKVSSGNVTLECMDINMAQMIQQMHGEFAEKLEANKLIIIENIPEEPVLIHVDGRRMSRILENIYGNCCKYAMEGTRVYADLKVVNAVAEFSLKNISSQALNISADELTERFIRGDVARTTEGSGLGLSIAKSLTTLQGGDFKLYLDGDLFRVTITFPIVERKEPTKDAVVLEEQEAENSK